MRLLPRCAALTLLFLSTALPVLASATPSARGDVNATGTIDGVDVTYLANYLLGSGPAPVRACLADVNADLSVNTADVFRLIDFVFAAGAAPPPQPTEVCDGADNNCDGQIDEGVTLTFYPDNDGDGFGTTSGSVQACSQPSGYALAGGDCNDANPAIHPGATELCNGIDDDCDGAIDEGINLLTDVNNCGSCGNVCSNPNGSTTCSIGTCVPTCNAGWVTCSDPDNGCETLLNTNPTCGAMAAISLSGDTGTPVFTTSGRGEAFFLFRFTEDDNWIHDLTGDVHLDSPSGADYDLTVYCTSCAGSPSRTSQNGMGYADVVSVMRAENFGADDSFNVVVEVKFYGATSTACGNWTLMVRGNLATSSPLTCP